MNSQADVKQVSLGVIQPFKVHAHAQALALLGDQLQSIYFFQAGTDFGRLAVA